MMVDNSSYGPFFWSAEVANLLQLATWETPVVVRFVLPQQAGMEGRMYAALLKFSREVK